MDVREDISEIQAHLRHARSEIHRTICQGSPALHDLDQLPRNVSAEPLKNSRKPELLVIDRSYV